MKYYSEDDVMDLIREAEDCERAYEWGEGHRRIHFEDYHPIEIPDRHGDLIDRNELPIIGITDYKLESHTVVEFEDVLNAPVIVEATE